MRSLLRILASALGALLVIGETLRSYGQGRPLAFVVDDYLIGGGLILGAIYFNADTLRRRAAFAAAWAATAGGLRELLREAARYDGRGLPQQHPG